jgi:hypothetical protein
MIIREPQLFSSDQVDGNMVFQYCNVRMG